MVKGESEVHHCKGLGPAFFQLEDDQPALYFEGAMKCRLPGGAFTHLDRNCRFECEDDRMVDRIEQVTERYDSCDFVPFEFYDTEVGVHERPSEVEVFCVC